jgi:hypothetical protein
LRPRSPGVYRSAAPDIGARAWKCHAIVSSCRPPSGAFKKCDRVGGDPNDRRTEQSLGRVKLLLAFDA